MAVGLGVNQFLLRLPPFRLLVLLLAWFHGLTGKVCNEIRGLFATLMVYMGIQK